MTTKLATNWMMRILLIALAVTLLFWAPAALGASGIGATLDAETSVEADAVTPAPPETTAADAAVVSAEAEADSVVADVPISADPVHVSTRSVEGLTGEPTVQTASEGDIEVLGRTTTKGEVATAGAVSLAAAGSAGALFWLKNALGLALGRFVGAPLFSRLSKDDLLENDGRGMLFTLVETNPGIGLQELADQSGLGWGTAVYHLGRLEQGGFISSMKNGQSRHFFKNGHPAAKNKMAVAVLKNRTAADVARFLLSTPGATQKTISTRLGIAPPTVTKYVKRLEAEGLVETLKEGRAKIVQPTAVLVEAMQHVEVPVPEIEAATTKPVSNGVSAYA